MGLSNPLLIRYAVKLIICQVSILFVSSKVVVSNLEKTSFKACKAFKGFLASLLFQLS